MFISTFVLQDSWLLGIITVEQTKKLKINVFKDFAYGYPGSTW